MELTLTAADAPVWRGLQSADGSLEERENDEIAVLASGMGEVVEVARALRDAPITLFFADGSTIVGDVRLPPRESPGPVPADRLLADAWDGVTITRELGEHGSVQARTAELAARDATWAVTDHGSGELADFISLTVDESATHLRFFHCKGSGGAAPGRRVGTSTRSSARSSRAFPGRSPRRRCGQSCVAGSPSAAPFGCSKATRMLSGASSSASPARLRATSPSTSSPSNPGFRSATSNTGRPAAPCYTLPTAGAQARARGFACWEARSGLTSSRFCN